MTIEELQTELINKQKEIDTLKISENKVVSDFETYKKDIEAKVTTLTSENETLRTHNNNLFLQVTQKIQDPNEGKEKDKEIEPLDSFLSKF